MQFAMLEPSDNSTDPIDRGVILDALSTAVLLLDHELKLKLINASAESLLAVSSTRSTGMKVTELIAEFRDMESILFDSLQTGQPYTQREAELTLPTRKTVTMDFTVSPMSEGDWPCLLVEFHPMDRYLRIDRDAALRKHQQSTQQMLRGLAHEIKNPLGGIRGSAQLLQAELDNEELTEYTGIIVEETDRLAALVDRLLGPITPPKFNPDNIHEVIEKTRLLVELESGARIEFDRDYDPSIPELMMDKELMQQAVLNIVRNAMQSLSDTRNPHITLRTRTERQFTIESVRHRNVLRIEIIDNGPGIPLEMQQNIFYPMITGRPDGTGLGLSVAQSIVHRHKGIIECESEPGHTLFTIIIPLELNNGEQ